MTQTTDPGSGRHDTLSDVTGRVGRGTARQTVRIDEADWEQLGARTADAGTDRSAVIRAFVDWYNGKAGAELPERPAAAGEYGPSREDDA
jgi:hypothetical protein